MIVTVMASLMLAHAPLSGYAEYDAEGVYVVLADHAAECTRRNDRRRKQGRATRRCMTGAEVEAFAIALLGAGARYDIDPLMLAAISKVESNWRVDVMGDCKQRNPKRRCGAYGLFQLHANAARGRSGEPSPCVRLAGSRKACPASLVCNDMTAACERSIEASALTAAWLLRKLIDKHGAAFALVGYNCGPWRCCADRYTSPAGRRICRRQIPHTSTTRKYMRVYRSLRHRLRGD